MPRTLVLGAALSILLATPHGQTLLAQQKTFAPPSSAAPSAAAMAMLPMASTSAAARMHATLGQRAADMGHQPEATAHFREALASDSTMAFAELGLANVATSVADYNMHVTRAVALSPHASPAEQLQIAIAQKTLVNDFVGAAQSAQQLVDAFPKSPRAYLALATVQQQMGNEAEGRRTLQRAIALAPDFSPAYAQLAFSYILSQPTDPAAAEPLAKKLIALEPREGMPYVIQGGLDRAINRLEPARQAYTRAAQLDPKNATTLLYLGHVDSFLGNFDAARADYDAAAKLSVANDAEQIAKYRALVAVHAGDSKRGIAELDQLANAIDGMTLADRLGGKIDALNAEFIVATQAGDFAGAARAIAQRTPLVRQQAAQTKNDRLIAQGEADIAYDDGLLAAKQGDFATAKAKAAEIMRLVAATQDPQKDQPAHALLGVVALEQKDYTGALEHFAHANPNDTYIWYERAVALEGAGKTDEAKALFRRVGSYNFNDPNIAAVRTDAAKRGA